MLKGSWDLVSRVVNKVTILTTYNYLQASLKYYVVVVLLI